MKAIKNLCFIICGDIENNPDKDFDFNNYLKDIGFIKNKLDK